MFTIKLINMPFAAVNIPSIAITQLKWMVEKHFGERVAVENIYLNHDFALFFGIETYDFIASSGEAHASGFGEWFFRQTAFPHLTDNSAEYFERYHSHFSSEFHETYNKVLARKRTYLPQFLTQLIEDYALLDADLVGFTSMFFQTLPSVSLARLIKADKPEVVTIMGGANCEAPMGVEWAQHLTCLDFVASGFGLVSFPELISCLLEGRMADAQRINGMFTRENAAPLAGKTGALNDVFSSRIVKAIGDEVPIGQELIDLDYDSFLDSFEEHFSHTDQKPYLLFETSRGCWWGERSHCTFCGLNGGTLAYRALPSDMAITLFRDLFDRYGDRVSHFSCVDNIIPREYLAEVFPALDVPEHVSIFYEVKADLKEEDMELLAKVNVFEIQPGIESLSTKTLKLMRKGTTAFNNIVFLMNTIRFGIHPSWNLLVGFPGEKAETYEKYLCDLPLLMHLPPPGGVFPVRFDRYSPYFNQANHYGLDLKPLDFYGLSLPFEPRVLANLAYYFKDHNYQAEYIKDVSRYLKRLQEVTGAWQSCWARAVNGEAGFPELYFKDADYSRRIFDSRFGEPMEFEISEDAKRLLSICARPKTRKRMMAELNGVSEACVQDALGELIDRRLLFQEGKGYVGIVLPHAPSWQRVKFLV